MGCDTVPRAQIGSRLLGETWDRSGAVACKPVKDMRVSSDRVSGELGGELGVLALDFGTLERTVCMDALTPRLSMIGDSTSCFPGLVTVSFRSSRDRARLSLSDFPSLMKWPTYIDSKLVICVQIRPSRSIFTQVGDVCLWPRTFHGNI